MNKQRVPFIRFKRSLGCLYWRCDGFGAASLKRIASKVRKLWVDLAMKKPVTASQTSDPKTVVVTL